MRDYSSYVDYEQRQIRRAQEELDALQSRYLDACDKAAEMLYKRYGVRRVYVFGSVLRPDFGQNSDVDLAVEGLRGSLFFDALADLSTIFGFQPDLVRLERTDPLLRERILDEGRVLNGGC